MKLSDKISSLKIQRLTGENDLDLGPISDSEYDLFMECTKSILTKRINRRLVIRTPFETLRAILVIEKNKSCGLCDLPWLKCFCWIGLDDQPF